MNKSWQKSPPHNAEFAIGAVRTVVAAARERGMKTIAAIDLYGPELGLMPRRARRLFERERVPFVAADECRRTLTLAAQVLRRIAEKMRERAEHWDHEADLLDLQQRQLSLWGDAAECRSDGGDSPQRWAA